MAALIELNGIVRHYSWGSSTAIPRLLGLEPTGEPAAELWLGAHPDDPSFAPERGTTLDRLIAADPVALLGAAVAEQFGGRLPFLLKVLAAEKALSMQVHPTLAQARAGYAEEEARGVPHDAPERNYKDANHKPELVCALSEFDALCGFRPVEATSAFFDELAVPALAPYGAMLTGEDGLRGVFTTLLTRPNPGPLIAEVVAALGRLAAGDGEWADTAAALVTVAADFPGDVGVVLALLLNYVRLQPGEALFLGAGNVHAYLRGVGVEIMANSDNVLRCGLTPKHVDIPELLKLTEFSELADPRWPARRDGSTARFAVPVPDFSLDEVRLDLDSSGQLAGGPMILLCTDGYAIAVAGADELQLGQGQAAFVPAGAAVTLAGAGQVFAAGVPVPGDPEAQET